MSEHDTRGSPPADAIADVTARFRAMHAASRAEPPPGAGERKALLRALRRSIAASQDGFAQAIAADYGARSRDETLMAEIVPALTLVRDCLAHVDAWMRPEPRSRAALFWPARNRVYRQPKGVVLIIAPWNYPLLLTVGPLAAALAAGNRVIVKPSEATPRTAALIKQRLEGALGPDRVAVALGGADMAETLTRLPFDHILFTGSAAVGAKVLAAAAPNLVPVTLELGGKSPVIVHESFDPGLAAARIMRGKLLNAGQTCIAPDYALVPAHRSDEFVRHLQAAAARFYPQLVENRDYGAIINQRHYQRLTELVADARAKGARVTVIDPAGELPPGEAGAANARKIAPIILTGVDDGMRVMQEEIFGPILPVAGYATLEEAMARVAARPRPLALYYFDDDGARVQRLLRETIAGGVSINDTVYHFAQEGLPFGGIGRSGMGAYHGVEGFRSFSHAKAVFFQSRLTLTSLLVPPYGRWFRRLIRLAIWRNGGGRAAA
jgi:coniferyl-aldehyde dehydrogenase